MSATIAWFKSVGSLIRHHGYRISFAINTSWIFSCAMGQYVVYLPEPDSCLLPSGSYLVWISDETEARVGEVYHLPTSAYVNAYLEGGTEAWMSTALGVYCAEVPVVDTIAIRITRLRCAESASGVNVRLGVYMDLDILRRSGNGWRVCYSTSASKEELCDGDDEERHERNILSALAACLDSYRLARDEGKLIDRPYEPEFAAMPGDYPILHVASLPKGIFRDLDAFRNARIERVDEGAITLDRNGKVRLRGDLGSKQDSIWALSDGSHLHLRMDKEFVRMNHTGDRLTATIRRNAEQQSGRMAVGVGFGAMGAMVTLPRKEEVRMRLDLPTGLLVPVDDPLVDTQAKHIINLSHYVGTSARVTVSYWGDRIALERDNYCEFDFPVGSGSELVRVESAMGGLWLALDNGSPGTFYHLIDLGADDVPMQKQLNAHMQEDMLGRLRPEMRRPAPVER